MYLFGQAKRYPMPKASLCVNLPGVLRCCFSYSSIEIVLFRTQRLYSYLSRNTPGPSIRFYFWYHRPAEQILVRRISQQFNRSTMQQQGVSKSSIHLQASPQDLSGKPELGLLILYIKVVLVTLQQVILERIKFGS